MGRVKVEILKKKTASEYWRLRFYQALISLYDGM
jgi:hypothetical protein